MGGFPWEIALLSAVLLSNRLTAKAFHLSARLFWTVQASNLGMAAFVAWYGLPGLERFGGVRWMVAGLLVFHAVQNFGVRATYAREARYEREEREQLRALRAVREADGAATMGAAGAAAGEDGPGRGREEA